MNAIKGEAIVSNVPRVAATIDASLFANSTSRSTFDAMQAAVTAALPDLRRWMRTKAGLHGHDPAAGLPWWDLVAPLPFAGAEMSWDDGVDIVRSAFSEYSNTLGGLVDRALDEQWIDAARRPGKSGGAFCASFVGRPLAGVAQLVGFGRFHTDHRARTRPRLPQHDAGGRTPLQRQLPMALAETASIFCETLVVEAGLARMSGAERLAQLDVDLRAPTRSSSTSIPRFLFET